MSVLQYILEAKHVQKQDMRILKRTTKNDKTDGQTFIKEIKKEKGDKTVMVVIPKKPKVVPPPTHILAKKMLGAAKCKSKAKKPKPSSRPT